CAPAITATYHGRSSRSSPVPDHGGGLAGARHEMIKAARSCPSRLPLTPGVTCCGWPRPARRTPARGGSGPERAASTPGAARPNRPARTREATPAPAGASGSVPPAACARIGGSRARRRPAPAAPGATRSRARRRRARIPDTAPRPWPGAVVGRARERSWWTGPGSAASCRRTSLEDPESRAPGSGVGVDLGVAGTEGLSRERPPAGVGETPEGRLDEAVLKGVKGDDAESPARRQEIGAFRESGLEAPQLVVDRDPDGLERPGRGMDPVRSPVRRDRGGDQVGELPARADGRPGPHLHQTPGDPPGRRLLAVLVDDPGQLGLGRPADQLGGGHRLPRV